MGNRKRGPSFSSEHPKLWGTGKGVPHSAQSTPHCGEQEKGPHIQLRAPGSAGEEVTKTPRMQKGLPVSQDPPHSLSTKKELEEILAALVAPSKPVVWCAGQLYPKNTRDVLNPSSSGGRGQEEGPGWRLQRGCEFAEQHRWVSPTSPRHTELTLVLSITPNPTEIMDNSWRRKSPWFGHSALTQLWRKPQSPSSPLKLQAGLCKPSTLVWVFPRGSCYTAAMGISLITRCAEWC